ncbi:uncharacterized protein [Prorops nasuta]|uniref:uncharacterized protein isoform X2 n=1 Tax=Prorops nasuta TaxID=863751 RepID=UPI0034CF0E2F
MARGISLVAAATSTFLFLLVLLQASFLWEGSSAAPTSGKKNDILAGTEFLSVFINGAMAPTPPTRRRGFRRGGHSTSAPPADSLPAESRHHETSIYRISRDPNVRPVAIRPQNQGARAETVRYYPISHKNSEKLAHSTALPSSKPEDDSGHQNFTPTPSTVTATSMATATATSTSRLNIIHHRVVSKQKVIGVSVTSTVEATPYKVRVEHYDGDSSKQSNSTEASSEESVKISSSTTTSSPIPARSVTEELSNIVSESNRSEFSVDEGSPRTSWHDQDPLSTPSSKDATIFQRSEESTGSPTDDHYQLAEENVQREIHKEPPDISMEHLQLQPRKVGRHYHHYESRHGDRKAFKSSRTFGEAVYGEPEKIYGEPAKIYGEPAKIYGEPEKIYSEPSKIYSEPAKIYSEPAKVYSQPAKVYDSNGRPVEDRKDEEKPLKIYHGEPDEENYEVDESVSVGSNGNVHGPQLLVTEAATSGDAEDGHKVSYVVEGRNYRKYRVEERTPDGFIVGEYGVVSHDDGSLRGVRFPLNSS